MIRMLSLMVAIVGLFLAPAALAIQVSVTNVSSSGGDVNLLQDGDILTVDVTVSNPGNLNVWAAALGVRGYDPDADGRSEGLNLVGGGVSSVLFADNSAIIPTVGTVYSGGINNSLATPTQEGTSIFPQRELHTLLFNGVATAAATGDGSFDGGPDDIPGGIHFTVQFQAERQDGLNPVQIDLTFGDIPDLGHVVLTDGGVPLTVTGDTLTVFVVPEPGTALLMGLGLAGLAIRRR